MPAPDRATVLRVLLRGLLVVAAYVLEWLDLFPEVPEFVFVLIAAAGGVLALWAIVGWAVTADWSHDARVTAEGHRTAHLRRAEAREIGAHVAEQKRLAKQRRRAARRG
jgi:flagellar biosynthesis component FlhA